MEKEQNIAAINSILVQYGIRLTETYTGLRTTDYIAALNPTAPVKKLLGMKDAFSIALNTDDIEIERRGNKFVISIHDHDDILPFRKMINQYFRSRTGLTVSLGFSDDFRYTDLPKLRICL